MAWDESGSINGVECGTLQSHRPPSPYGNFRGIKGRDEEIIDEGEFYPYGQPYRISWAFYISRTCSNGAGLKSSAY